MRGDTEPFWVVEQWWEEEDGEGELRIEDGGYELVFAASADAAHGVVRRSYSGSPPFTEVYGPYYLHRAEGPG